MQLDQDERDNQGKLVKWLDSTALGRKVLAVKSRWDDFLFEHRYRYSSLDEQAYRFWCWTLFLVILFTVLATSAWCGRSLYRHYAEQHDQAQAEAFFKRGEYRAAILSARQTLSINASNLPACRVMAQIADLSSSPAALDWLQRIVVMQPTVDNKLLLAGAGLRYQQPPYALTARILQELPAAATNQASCQIIIARLALALNQLTEAETHFAQALILDPTNQLFALNLATLRLAMTNEASKSASRLVLNNLKSDSELGPAALRALVVDRWENQDFAGANTYSSQLIENPAATLADQMQNLKILQRLKSADFPPRLAVVQEQAATNAVAIEQVSSWMQANGLVAENIQWLTNLPEDMEAQQPIQLALAQACLQNSDWPALRQLASLGNWGTLEYLRFALVSHASAKLGMSDLAALNWGSAVNEAGARLDVYIKLLQLAETWQLNAEQVELLKRIVEHFPKERWAQQRLAQHDYATGDTVGLYELYAHVHIYFPKDVDYLNNLAATALMLKTNLPEVYRWAATAYTNAPGNPYEASTYAYALHLLRRDKEGLEVLQKLPPAQLNQQSVALYYGILLEANGKVTEARPYLERAQAQGGLWPEEQALLDTALHKVAGRNP